MEKSMQQIQSEQDKMVPIDTSGDPVDVEIKDSNEKEVKTESKESDVIVEEQTSS